MTTKTAAIEALCLTVSEKLKQQQFVLSTAESCTGGGLSYFLTQLPGSSTWFDRGFVTYTNEAKIALLNVSEVTLKQVGAVSEEAACEMAEGALKQSLANLAIAITGIAGPTGSQEKPVGLVWFALAAKHLPTTSAMNIFTGNRNDIRLLAIQRALEIILEKI